MGQQRDLGGALEEKQRMEEKGLRAKGSGRKELPHRLISGQPVKTSPPVASMTSLDAQS